MLEEEWEESMDALKQVFAVVVLPYAGKWLGHWG